MADDFADLVKNLKFDATRWNLAELQVGQEATTLWNAAAQTVAGENWRSQFETAAVGIRDSVKAHYEQSIAVLRADIANNDVAGKAELSRVQILKAGTQEQLAQAEKPPTLVADPSRWQAAIRVTDAAGSTGLPGLILRLVATEATIATHAPAPETMTDAYGNAAISLPATLLPNVGTAPLSITIARVDDDQKILFTAHGVAHPKPGAVATIVIKIPDSVDVKAETVAGRQNTADLAQNLKQLAAQESGYAARITAIAADLNSRIGEMQAILDATKQ